MKIAIILNLDDVRGSKDLRNQYHWLFYFLRTLLSTFPSKSVSREQHIFRSVTLLYRSYDIALCRNRFGVSSFTWWGSKDGKLYVIPLHEDLKCNPSTKKTFATKRNVMIVDVANVTITNWFLVYSFDIKYTCKWHSVYLEILNQTVQFYYSRHILNITVCIHFNF